MLTLTVPAAPVLKLLHRRRVRIDPAFRVECHQLFADPRIRMAYYSSKGLLVDDLGEALWDAGFTGPERPSCVEVIDLLAEVLAPAGSPRQRVTLREADGISRQAVEDIARQLETRKGNRWRSYRCQCEKGRPFRFAGDALPVTVVLRCLTCGESYTLQTIMLDLSNVDRSAMEVPF